MVDIVFSSYHVHLVFVAKYRRKVVTVQFESAGYVDFMVAREALLAVP